MPLRDWKGIPDITKCAEKVDSNDEDLLEDIQSLQEFDIRVCNVCYYHAQEDKLIQDIQQVRWPKIARGFNNLGTCDFFHNFRFSQI